MLDGRLEGSKQFINKLNYSLRLSPNRSSGSKVFQAALAGPNLGSQTSPSLPAKLTYDPLLIREFVRLLVNIFHPNNRQAIQSQSNLQYSVGSSNFLPSRTSSPTSLVIPVTNNSQINMIPEPKDYMQSFLLGNKTLTMGSDGSASAEETGALARVIKDLYQQSSVFKEMIDISTDTNFTLTVGRRGDNTSWGNTDGSVFININNIAPSHTDTFQSLVAHEFAHASIDIGHGDTIERIERAVAMQV